MVNHSEYIRKLSDETGKSYRELETYWRIAEDTYRKLQMVNPSQYEHLREAGAESQEIQNIFEKSILKLPDIREETAPTEEAEVAEDEFGAEIEEDMLADEGLGEETLPEEDFSEFDIEPEPETTAEKLEKAESESASTSEEFSEESEDDSDLGDLFVEEEKDVERGPIGER